MRQPPTIKDKAVWSKFLYDQYLKKQEVYNDYKAKVFTIIMGQCTEVMKNKIEGTTVFAQIEAKYGDVVKLLKMMKNITYGSDNKMYPHMQAGGALKQFVNIRQQEKEEMLHPLCLPWNFHCQPHLPPCHAAPFLKWESSCLRPFQIYCTYAPEIVAAAPQTNGPLYIHPTCTSQGPSQYAL